MLKDADTIEHLHLHILFSQIESVQPSQLQLFNHSHRRLQLVAGEHPDLDVGVAQRLERGARLRSAGRAEQHAEQRRAPAGWRAPVTTRGHRGRRAAARGTAVCGRAPRELRAWVWVCSVGLQLGLQRLQWLRSDQLYSGKIRNLAVDELYKWNYFSYMSIVLQ